MHYDFVNHHKNCLISILPDASRYSKIQNLATGIKNTYSDCCHILVLFPEMPHSEGCTSRNDVAGSDG